MHSVARIQPSLRAAGLGTRTECMSDSIATFVGAFTRKTVAKKGEGEVGGRCWGRFLVPCQSLAYW
jgi:hypothetical protein